jgi:hypothetical protein
MRLAILIVWMFSIIGSPAFAGSLQQAEGDLPLKVRAFEIVVTDHGPRLFLHSSLDHRDIGCEISVDQVRLLGTDLVSLAKLLIDTDAKLICRDVRNNPALQYTGEY